MPFVVLKFGGTSVATAARWGTIADITRQRLADGEHPVLVCSALAGVSNDLAALPDAAAKEHHRPLLERIEARHRALATDLGVEIDDILAEHLEPVRRLASGVALVGEATSKLRARMLAAGELLSTLIGARWLRAQGLAAVWRDAREMLQALPSPGARGHLSAACDDAADPALAEGLAKDEVVITQGFIARNAEGDTVLLGRGGSDTSAALFAARLGAVRCEIWTDVAGIFTANPRDIPTARLLRRLDYDEAQEIATAGAKVLHPRCLAPVRRHGIPLYVKNTLAPDAEGTVISADAPTTAEVKAIAARRGVTLISMDTLGMWQQVGFLADVFACFKRHGISVDLVSTSEANVTASFEPAAGEIDDDTLDALVADLSPLCRVRLIRPCGVVSLVGRNIRTILHKLGPALSVFESEKIHLVSQAASDLNLTFVVDEGQVDRLVRALHGLLFDTLVDEKWLDGKQPSPAWVAAAAPPKRPAWWRDRREALLAVADEGSPAYVYHGPGIDAAAGRLRAIQALDRVLYAVKANDFGPVLRRVRDAGLGFECVSPGELDHVRAEVPGLTPDRLLFTPNFAPREDYARALGEGLLVTVDNLHPLEVWPDLFRGREIFLRLDPGRGQGHHAHVRTAGPQSKFGIAPDQLDAVRAAVIRAGARVAGLHAHAGSGIRKPDAWQDTARFLLQALERFPDVRVLDLGGGLGVPEKPGQRALDVAALDKGLQRVKDAHPDLALWLEPGRYLVAEAGVLLTRVTQVKHKGALTYVGVDTGMNSLIRPALYGAWHDIVNLTRLDEPATWQANVVGPICETGDTLGYGRRLPPTREGDVLLIATTGAYGHTMSSNYNRRPPAREVLLGE